MYKSHCGSSINSLSGVIGRQVCKLQACVRLSNTFKSNRFCTNTIKCFSIKDTGQGTAEPIIMARLVPKIALFRSIFLK